MCTVWGSMAQYADKFSKLERCNFCTAAFSPTLICKWPYLKEAWYTGPEPRGKRQGPLCAGAALGDRGSTDIWTVR